MFNNDINLNLYKVFYDVARYGSFSKTAEFTYTTQSAISKSIKKLEEELDTQLFYRNSKGIELTEKGRELLFYVEKAFGNLVTAERVMVETENLERGKLNIGLPSFISSFLLSNEIKDFHNKYPNIEISITNGTREYLLDLLNKHQIDFAIYAFTIVDDINDKDLDTANLYSVKYTFFCKTEDYEKYKNVKSIKDLENVPLVLPIHGTNNRKYLEEVLIKNNVRFNKVINIHTSEGILTGVKNDMGIGYIISDIIKSDNNYKAIEVKEKLREENIIIIYNKKFLTPASRRFIEENLKIEI